MNIILHTKKKEKKLTPLSKSAWTWPKSCNFISKYYK